MRKMWIDGRAADGGGAPQSAVDPATEEIIAEYAWGGVSDAEDVMEFLVAGAAAVQMGTATFTDPMIIPDVIERLKTILAETGSKSIQEFIGTLQY